MANEWVKDELYGENDGGSIRSYTIADEVSVSQGQLLQLLDDRTVSCGHLIAVPIAGVAAEDHLPGVGATTIAVWTEGRFRVYGSGAIVQGHKLTCAENTSNNHLRQASLSDLQSSLALICAVALESAATGETLTVRLNPLR